MLYDVEISARKEGAIGAHGTERRKYIVEAARLDDVNRAAIDAAYKEGGIEHVNVTRVTEHGRKPANPNCDGACCASAIGPVKVFPLGAGGNLILCFACWANENRYRYNRGRKTGRPDDWPQENWHAAEIYDSK